MADGTAITPDNLGLKFCFITPDPFINGLGLKEAKAKFEAELVSAALKRYRGSVQLAAKAIENQSVGGLSADAKIRNSTKAGGRQACPFNPWERIVQYSGTAQPLKSLTGFQQSIFLTLRNFLLCKGRMCNSEILANVGGGVIYSSGRGLGVGQVNPFS